MSKFKMVNDNVEGEFELNFCDLTIDCIDVSNYKYHNREITDEEIIQNLENMQQKVNDATKYILDTLTYSAVKHLYNDDYHIYHACEIGIIDGERELVLSPDRIEALEKYANKIKLTNGYKNYEGDITSYVTENFPELDLDLIVLEYDLFEGIMADGFGGFSYTPDGDTDVWEGDYIEVDSNMFATISGH